MKKYYIGILIIALFTLGLGGFVVVQAASAKQDTETSRKANDIAKKLNEHVSSKGVPESLDAAGIDDVPSTISYSKKSDDSYEFCVTYKSASEGFNGGGFEQVLSGSFQQNIDREYDYEETERGYTPSYLYLPSTHKAGKDCQTVKTYSYNSRYKENDSYDSYYDDAFCGSGICKDNAQGSSTSSAADTERQLDIKALHGQIEAFYATNGFYPTLANVNDSIWRKTNMKGLDAAALKDPKGTSSALVAAPAKNIYSYKVSSDNGKPCDNAAGNACTFYTLQATLDNGTQFSKLSLN